MRAQTKIMLSLAVSISFFIISFPVKGLSSAGTGESLFMTNCSPCHPDGGNILNPKKTLHKADREANKILTAEDIIKKMRNPGPAPTHPQDWAGMKMFDKYKISDEDALRIANYILETFK